MSHSIVVTGASGFAGSHVLEALNRIGHKELHIIAACRDRRKLIPEFKGEVRVGDLRDPDYMDRVLAGADIVCHCAAWTSFWGNQQASRELYLEPSLQLIDKGLEWRVKRFINLSSTSAAAPQSSANAYAPGVTRRYWPHLNNIIAIENYMQENAHRNISMVNLRLGLFAGQRYGLGILPLLLPRLKSHLLPWIAGGKTGLPLIDGRDIGQAVVRAALAPQLPAYAAFNIVGPEIPRVREVINYISDHFDYPKPHFSLPFFAAYRFAWLMEKLDRVFPWEPLITRSMVLLLEETGANNEQAHALLGYIPEIHWQEALHRQLSEMKSHQFKNMKMARPINPLSIDGKK